MSNTVYATALGLVIPVLGISVCSRLWKQGRVALCNRKSSSSDGIRTLGFAIRVLLLLGACSLFNHVASSMKMESEHFDPYRILELSSRTANATLIRSQYHKLSVKHHPDKNPSIRRAATAQFNKVAKAYQALSDPQARRNWEKYGHPDGYQPWTSDLALPAWLRPGKDTSNATFVLYAIGYMAVLIGFVLSVKLGVDVLDPIKGRTQPVFHVTEDSVKALLNSLDNTSSIEDVLEGLAACPQLCSEERRALAVKMEPVMMPIRNRLIARGASFASLCAVPFPTSQTETTEKNARKEKRKGKKKKENKISGSGSSGAGDERHRVDVDVVAKHSEDVVGEFHSKGRRGEQNPKATRSFPEISQVVMHNLVVLLSGLYRENIAAGGNGGHDASGGDYKVNTPESSAASTNAQRTELENTFTTVPPADHGSTNYGCSDNQVFIRANGTSNDKGDMITSSLPIEASIRLEDEQQVVFGLAEPLLDACLKVAAQRGSPLLFRTVVEVRAMLRRRIWSSQNSEALRKQASEADVELDAAVPRVTVKSIAAETWGENQIALGDTVTATITMAREHACEYQGFRRRRPVDGFLSRGEPWWIILAGGKERETLIGVCPLLVENLNSKFAECKIKFQAPRRPCMMLLTVIVKSPVFVGVDCEGTTSFRVYRHDELKQDEDVED